jgi:hypothetical protein
VSAVAQALEVLAPEGSGDPQGPRVGQGAPR